MTKRGRPELFNEEKRAAFIELVKRDQTRQGAAVALGVDPSTVSKRIQRDPVFAEAVQAAEQQCENELLGLMRKHCEKSWLATRWLLEMKYPERYGKRKATAASGPSADEVFDAVIGVLAEEIADETLRSRVEARLDALAAKELFNGHDAAHAAMTEEDQHGEEQAVELIADVELIAGDPVATDEAAVEDEGADQDESAEKLPPGEIGEPLVATEPGEVDSVAANRAVSFVERVPLVKQVEKPPPSTAATIVSMRAVIEEKKWLRKQRNKERKKQLKPRRRPK